MTGRRLPGGLDPADLRLLREARREAQTAVAAAEARCGAERRTAFRWELAAPIREVSPFLLSLLTAEGLTLADVVDRVVPTSGWPRRPMLPGVARGWKEGRHAIRHSYASAVLGLPGGKAEMLHGFAFRLGVGGWANVRLVARGLEVTATSGTAVFRSRSGGLRVAIASRLPAALTAAAIGRPLDDVLIHPAIVGCGWRVNAVERREAVTTLVVATRFIPWRTGPL